DDLRELREVESRDGCQARVPSDMAGVAVVGAPAQYGRVRGGHRASAGAHGEVFGHVEEVARLRVLRWSLAGEPQALAHRILAGAAGRAAGLGDPGAQLAEAVSAEGGP